MRYKFVYALWGSFLGLGAPLGALLIRLIFFHEGHFQMLSEDYKQFAFFYDYMAFGTILSFTFFGYVLGLKLDNSLRKEQQFYELSIRDPLTSIYNRRYMERQLEAELNRAKRYNTPLSCLMLDIDFFKKINDTYGHIFGDKVLLTMVSIISKKIRDYDIFARYGGEEFIIVLPHTNKEEAENLAERIRSEIQISKVDVPNTQILLKKDKNAPKQISATISIGVCTFPDHVIETPEEFIKHTDSALYEAKQKGRNQTRLCKRDH